MSLSPARISVLGATSLSHGRKVLNDLFSVGALEGCSVTLMAPLADRLRLTEQYARKVIDHNHLQTTIHSTTRLPEAIDGADYIIALFDVGGIGAYRSDYEIARRYGIDLCIGDTMGPTGIMKGARNIALLRSIGELISKHSPGALLVSYVNPMAMSVIAADRLGIGRVVGVCGGIEATRRLIARCLEIDSAHLDTRFAGINHMCWALEISSGGEDLYPRFKREMQRPDMLESERVRIAVMQHFGYFATETSGHLSDFLPWFRRDEQARRRYCPPKGYSGGTGAYLRYAEFVHRRLGSADHLEFETGEIAPRGSDDGVSIIEALEGGTECACYGNVMNSGPCIANLPESSCVEIPLRVEAGARREGARLHPDFASAIPSQLAALNQTNITVQQLAVEGILAGDAELVAAALSLDPLVASVLDLPESRMMTQELLAANASFLTWFPTTRLSPTPKMGPIGSSVHGPETEDELLAFVRELDQKRRQAGS